MDWLRKDPARDSASFATVDESSAIKGMLILLIIIGHNAVFTRYYESLQLMGYLYMFHIQAFFMLPFIYGAKPLSKARVSNSFFRLYWPYLLLSAVLYAAYYLVACHHHFSGFDLLRLWLIGENHIIKEYCGLQILWFMPAMFSLTILKDVYYGLKSTGRTLLLILSAFAFALTVLSGDYGYFYHLRIAISDYIPFGFFSGLGYLIMGVAVREIISARPSRLAVIIVSFLFVALSVAYFFCVTNGWNRRPLYAVMPFLFFILVFQSREVLARSSILKSFGRLSFAIYIFHPFIGYALEWLAARIFNCGISDLPAIAPARYIPVIILSTLLMALGSWGCAKLLNSVKPVYNLIFPRSFSELKSVFTR